MFKNPGRQIQIIALFIFWVEVILFSIGAFVLVSTVFSNSDFYYLILAAAIVVGVLVAGLSTLFMYAIGTLIENVEITRINTQLQLEQINLLVGIARSIAIQLPTQNGYDPSLPVEKP